MEFQLRYINVFDDINSTNIDDIQQFFNTADIKVDGNMPMPNFDDSNKISTYLAQFGYKSGSQIELNSRDVVRHLKEYAQLPENVAEAIAKDIPNELKMLVPSAGAIIATYSKILYWIRTVFNSVMNDSESNIYIHTKVDKHTLYVIYLMSKLSNNIVVVDDSFKKEKYQLYNNILFNCSGTSERKKLSNNIEIPFDTLEKVMKGEMAAPFKKLVVIGEDTEGKLNSLLVDFAKSVPNETLLLKTGMQKASYEETSRIPVPKYETVSRLAKSIGPHMFSKTTINQVEAANYIRREIEKETNVSRATSSLISFIALVNRGSTKYKTIVSYANLDKQSEEYFSFLATLGTTIIVIDTEGKSDKYIDDSWSTKIIGEKVPSHEYPIIAVNNSIAYNASREIDSTLYNGETLGLYRDRQYSTCTISNLNTTFDEMLILWKEENTVKPGFSSTSSEIVVPVIYAKVCGVCADYKNTLGKFITDHTIVCYKPSEIMNGWLNEMKVNNHVCIDGSEYPDRRPLFTRGDIKVENILKCRNFTYQHLDTSVQQHIASKIALLIKSKSIDLSDGHYDTMVDKVLNVLLNMSKRFQQEIQWYDYTKQSPKLVVLCQDETTLTFEQSVVVAFLHLCGWDIVFIVPTCYNIFGRYLNTQEVQEHLIGEPKFDMSITHIEPYVDPKKKSFIQRLFS